MDNIQLCYIDNEINKIDKMKQGDVIYKNGMELLVVLSYDHNEPCKGCFFYKNKACGSEKLIKCWDCKKEYIFTAIRKYNTTELCGIVKRYEETCWIQTSKFRYYPSRNLDKCLHLHS